MTFTTHISAVSYNKNIWTFSHLTSSPSDFFFKFVPVTWQNEKNNSKLVKTFAGHFTYCVLYLLDMTGFYSLSSPWLMLSFQGDIGLPGPSGTSGPPVSNLCMFCLLLFLLICVIIVFDTRSVFFKSSAIISSAVFPLRIEQHELVNTSTLAKDIAIVWYI